MSRTATPIPLPDSGEESALVAWIPQVAWAVSWNSGCRGRGRHGRAVVVVGVQHPLGQVVDPVAVGAGVLEHVLQHVVHEFRRHRQDAPARGVRRLQHGHLARVGRDDGDPEVGEHRRLGRPASSRAGARRRRSRGCRRRWRCRLAPSRPGRRPRPWRTRRSAGRWSPGARRRRRGCREEIRTQPRSVDLSLFPLIAVTRRVGRPGVDVPVAPHPAGTTARHGEEFSGRLSDTRTSCTGPRSRRRYRHSVTLRSGTTAPRGQAAAFGSGPASPPAATTARRGR